MTSPPPASTPRHYVHLVGSVPLADTPTIFRTIAAALPTQLQRLPDGEPGERSYFVWWQRNAVGPTAAMLRTTGDAYGGRPARDDDASSAEAAAIVGALAPLQTGYDAAALASFAQFAALQRAGVLPRRLRFQLSVPAPLNPVALHLRAPFKPLVEPLYAAALGRALAAVQAAVPHERLAVQVDCAVDFMVLEGVNLGVVEPWFPPTVAEVARRIAAVLDCVETDVPAGIHLCYGDSEHKHFVEPRDMGLMVDVALAVMELAQRKLDWVHMPVPKDRVDDAYFEPLLRLRPEVEKSGTDVILGVVHANDEEGTRERMKTASKFIGDNFAIATECGLGRTPVEHLDSILKISASVADG